MECLESRTLLSVATQSFTVQSGPAAAGTAQAYFDTTDPPAGWVTLGTTATINLPQFNTQNGTRVLVEVDLSISTSTLAEFLGQSGGSFFVGETFTNSDPVNPLVISAINGIALTGGSSISGGGISANTGASALQLQMRSGSETGSAISQLTISTTGTLYGKNSTSASNSATYSPLDASFASFVGTGTVPFVLTGSGTSFITRSGSTNYDDDGGLKSAERGVVTVTYKYVTPCAYICISPNGANEVNVNHTFTANVYADDGFDAGDVYAGFTPDSTTGPQEITGAATTITLTNSNGASAPTTPFTGNSPLSATFTSATAGLVTGHATATVVVDGVTFNLATDGLGYDSGDATKYFANANITLQPLNATNPVNAPHTVSVTVMESDGTSATWFAAPAGTQVTISMLNNGTNEVFTSTGTSAPITVTLGANGTATFTTNGDQAGSVTYHAEVVLDITTPNGVVSGIDRATGDGLGETSHWDSNNAVKNRHTGNGASATIGFWHNKNGQGLITAAGTALANYLAVTWPNLFGAGTGNLFNTYNTGPIHFVNLKGQSGANVAAFFLRIFDITGPKTYAQIMCTALAAYFDLNNSSSQKFGFGNDLLSNSIVITAAQASALGLSTTAPTVSQILSATNSLMLNQHGVIPSNLFITLNDVFDSINQTFDIG